MSFLRKGKKKNSRVYESLDDDEVSSEEDEVLSGSLRSNNGNSLTNEFGIATALQFGTPGSSVVGSEFHNNDEEWSYQMESSLDTGSVYTTNTKNTASKTVGSGQLSPGGALQLAVADGSLFNVDFDSVASPDGTGTSLQSRDTSGKASLLSLSTDTEPQSLDKNSSLPSLHEETREQSTNRKLKFLIYALICLLLLSVAVIIASLLLQGDESRAITPAPTSFIFPQPTTAPSEIVESSSQPSSLIVESMPPSDVPSLAPTSAPSVTSSSAPTSPTPVPSASPSTVPSLAPSLLPSNAPSQAPSDGSPSPSDSPSHSPTSYPSLVPSQMPSVCEDDDEIIFFINSTPQNCVWVREQSAIRIRLLCLPGTEASRACRSTCICGPDAPFFP